MPHHASSSKMHSSVKQSPKEPEAAAEQVQEQEPAAEKEAVMNRLITQGAVPVMPGAWKPSASSSASSASAAPAAPSTVSEAPAAVSEAASPVSAEPAAQASVSAAPASASAAPAPAEAGQATQSMVDHNRKADAWVDSVNNPKWHDVGQHIRNARDGKQQVGRERRQTMGVEEAAKSQEDYFTEQHRKEMNPEFYRVDKHIRNAARGAVDNPGQTAAGMIPVAGSLIKQKLAEKRDVKERDLLKGIAASSAGEVQEGAASQASAISTKINNDRFKAGVGAVTGVVGKVLPPGVGTAINTGIGAAAGQYNKKELNQVADTRAREQARKQLKKKEFAGYDGVEHFMALESQRKSYQAVGQGKEGAAAPAVQSADQTKQLVAHARGDLQFHDLYKKRAKELEKERQEAQRPPQAQGGLLGKIKGLFRS